MRCVHTKRVCGRTRSMLPGACADFSSRRNACPGCASCTPTHQSRFLLTHTHSPSTDLPHAMRLIRLSLFGRPVIPYNLMLLWLRAVLQTGMHVSMEGAPRAVEPCCVWAGCVSMGKRCRGGLPSVAGIAYQATTREGCGYLGGRASCGKCGQRCNKECVLCGELTTANHSNDWQQPLVRAFFVAVLARVFP